MVIVKQILEGDPEDRRAEGLAEKNFKNNDSSSETQDQESEAEDLPNLASIHADSF